MTFTVHWWLIPLMLIVAGFWFQWRAHCGDVWQGIVTGFIGIVAWLLAAAFCLGHWV